MKTLKKTIRQYMLRITGLLVLIILVAVTGVQMLREHCQEYESSVRVLAQIGRFMGEDIESRNATEETGQERYSYMLSMLRVNSEAKYYVISGENGEIIGATDAEAIGKPCEEIGLRLKNIKEDADGFYARIGGKRCFCVFQKMGNEYVGRCVEWSRIHQNVPTTVVFLALCLMTIAGILAYAVSCYMNRYVVDGIHQMSEGLCRISEGNYEVKIDIRTSTEFSELSDYINMMVGSLSDSTSKISYVLSKTNMYIGVYEYRKGARVVHCTEYIPRIFSLELDEWKRLTSDYEQFQKFIEEIRIRPFEGEQGVYVLCEEPEKYVKLEEMEIGQEVFGVVIDVTEEVLRRRKIEAERDVDLLTGLYNRRGLETYLSLLFRKPEKLGVSALVMLDADGLKGINDTYGHEMGDIYLKKIGSVIQNFGIRSSLASRLGGDEFVLFLYDYEDKDELLHTVQTLEYIQGNSMARLRENLTVPLRFSFGYCMMADGMSYAELLKKADERMYENKRIRKAKARQELDGGAIKA